MKKKLEREINKKKEQGRVARVGKDIIAFPAKLITPIGNFLQNRLKQLQKRKEEIGKEDPFKNTSRILDNASPDTDAAEQFGHARTAAIEEQLENKIKQTQKALKRIKQGKYGICEDCGEMIDTDRLMVYPEATFCASCQAKREK